MTLLVVPCTVKRAKAEVFRLHRHLKVVGWGRFAVALTEGGGACRWRRPGWEWSKCLGGVNQDGDHQSRH